MHGMQEGCLWNCECLDVCVCVRVCQRVCVFMCVIRPEQRSGQLVKGGKCSSRTASIHKPIKI